MKATMVFLLTLSAMAFASAQTAVVTSPVTSSAAVVSPLTTSTAQSNQALLSQINATLSQRRFEHETLTLTTPVTPVVITATPQIIRAK